jgi:hypothetical protein
MTRRSGSTPATLAASLLAAALALAGPPRALANCGAEGCPLDLRGFESSSRRWSFDIAYQRVEQDKLWDGTQEVTEPDPDEHITELFTNTRSWVMNGRAQILPSLRLNAMVPYIERVHAHEEMHELHPGHFEPERYEWRYEGLGDAMVFAQWTALASARSGAVALQGGIKLPTGKEHVGEINGEEPEPPARPGTGSTDGLAGIQLSRSWEVPALGGGGTTLPVVISAMGRWNGVGTDGYRVGNEWHASFATSYPLGRGVSLLAQANAVFHGTDEVGNTHAEPHHTGGTSVFATPGLRLELPGGSAVYGYWQMRVYERTNGPQLIAPSHVILGASFGIGG